MWLQVATDYQPAVEIKFTLVVLDINFLKRDFFFFVKK